MSFFVSRRPAVFRAAVFATAMGLWMLSGCNVFSPLASDDQKDLTYHGLILRGNKAINDKDYAAAESYFADAMAMNPKGSEAFLYRSKALMNKHNIDYNSLNKEFEIRRNKDGKGKKGVPFIDSATTLKSIDSIYYPVAQSVEYLEHIIRKKTEPILLSAGFMLPPDGDTASDGKISEGVARLDLGLLEAVKAMLGPLDLDGDNHISNECGKNICPNLDASCKATSVYIKHCKEGVASEVIRFENFKRLTRSLNINKISSDDVSAQQLSSNPGDINDFLDKMAGPIAGSTFNLDSVTGAMNGHNETKLSGNLSEIVGNIKDLSFFLAYMRHNDGLDNDFDISSASGTGTPMIWYDYDKDGGIRWDYSEAEDLLLAGYIKTPKPDSFANPDAVNIGHPLQRLLHPELYIKFADQDWQNRTVEKDNSKNSRKSLMIDRCITVATNMLENGKVDAALKLNLISVVCSTTTSILKPNVNPASKSNWKSDWVSGTYGIDEEMIDDRDNDYDGIQDEDSRNTKGMDDDHDADLNLSMVGKIPPPMVWKDVAGHLNGCIDIDTTKNMLAPPLQRQNCIGSLEHRLYLAQNGTGPEPLKTARDTLRVYYSAYPGEGANKDCLEDFEKLDPDFKTVTGLANKDAATLDIINLACKYKHIWIHDRPAHSEWTSGTLGIDEEITDGIDNDGDGWIDEDVK
jgi:hypothetical protein